MKMLNLLGKKKINPKEEGNKFLFIYSSQHLSIHTSSPDGPEDLYENLTDCLYIFIYLGGLQTRSVPT
jgi:hypothetical protein